MLLCGRTGSGKTTLSKSVLAAIDTAERLITIEDTPDDGAPPPSPGGVVLSKGRVSGAGCGAEDLLEASLRMRPDRVLMQELRDGAAWTYVNEVVSGHPGLDHNHSRPWRVRGLPAAVRARQIVAKGLGVAGQPRIGLIAAAIDVIIPLEESGGVFGIGSVWFAADAARRGQTAADLLREA